MATPAQHVADADAVVGRPEGTLGEEGNGAHCETLVLREVAREQLQDMGSADEARYRARSLWLDSGPEPLTPRPSLPGDLDCDVAIVGAGFTGLWSAYYLKRHQPDLRVAVVESEIAGYGPSGRHGGWVSSGLSGSAQLYRRSHGQDAVVRAHRETVSTVDEIGRVIE